MKQEEIPLHDGLHAMAQIDNLDGLFVERFETLIILYDCRTGDGASVIL